jgi:hypothetical protein
MYRYINRETNERIPYPPRATVLSGATWACLLLKGIVGFKDP